MHLQYRDILYITPPTILVLLSIGSSLYIITGSIVFLILFTICCLPNIKSFIYSLVSFKVNKSNVLSYSLLLLTFICYTRGCIHNTIDLFKAVFLLSIWLVLFITYKYSNNNRCLWFGIIFYVIFNFVLFCLGVSAPRNAYSETGDAKLLSLIGVGLSRVQFPITLGVNGFGIIAGLAACLSLAYMLEKNVVISKISFVTCVLVLMLTDSRGAFAGFLFTGIIVLMIRISKSVFFTKIVSISTIIVYPILSYMFYSLVLYFLGDLSGLSRGGGILSGRDVIWEGIFDFIKSASIFDLLFGYGYLGQATSGVSQSYFALFSHLEGLDAEHVNVHSSFFQLMLDMGAVGVIVVLLILANLLYLSCKRIRENDMSGLYGLSFVIYGVLAGATDLTFNQNNLVIYSIIIGISVTLKNYESFVAKDSLL